MRCDSEQKTGGVAVVVPSPVAGETRPYRAFLDALEELSLVVSLHGTASDEANEARATVRRAREVATEAWRQAHAAA